jgi:hypothetical protein
VLLSFFWFPAFVFHSLIVVSLTFTANLWASFFKATIHLLSTEITMFSKQESAQLKKEFWTAFGQYMKPVPSAEGEKINWVNYKTGEKDIFFKMNADNKGATIAIEISHPDLVIQQIYFEQFQQLKSMLESSLQEEWRWSLHTRDETGKIISKIFKTLEDVSVFNKSDWPAIISFFKPRIVALDDFWSAAKYGFEALR